MLRFPRQLFNDVAPIAVFWSPSTSSSKDDEPIAVLAFPIVNELAAADPYAEFNCDGPIRDERQLFPCDVFSLAGQWCEFE